MFKKALLGMCIGLSSTSFVYAQAPKVAVDIAPLHSLVSQVMDGVGQPDLLIRKESSPHEYTLRPSEAKALADADVVFWIGEKLTPWLEKPLDSLATSATKIEMMEAEGTTLHDFRKGATFEDHVKHHESEEGHDEGAHEEEDHKEHAHEEDKHEGHESEEGHDAHHHHHEGLDPHIWLDPKNAEVWVTIIADALSEKDQENAQTYQSNAKAAVERLQQLTSDIQSQANELKDIKFVVFHDAYQYFEQRFGLKGYGAIALSDASDPSPARISEIKQTVKELGVTCVFTEPQFNPELVNAVFEGSTVNTIGVMDPLGATIETGKDQYVKLLTAMITSLNQCQR